MRVEQLPLFPQRGVKGEYATPLVETPELTSDSSLKSAVGEFRKHMKREGFTENTQKAFHSDLRLLMRYLGGSTSVGEVSTKQLQDFLEWLLDGRGVPCSPKSYARRVTTLKRFFAWLTETGVIAGDPAAPIPHQYVRYSNPRMRKKERKLALSPDLLPVLDRYLAQYQPQERLFECTDRNLEYVLDDAGKRAGIDHIAFEMLRWTCAVHDYRAGMDPEDVRQKHGNINVVSACRRSPG